MYVCMYACMYVYSFESAVGWLHASVHMYVCMHVCMYILLSLPLVGCFREQQDRCYCIQAKIGAHMCVCACVWKSAGSFLSAVNCDHARSGSRFGIKNVRMNHIWLRDCMRLCA